MGLLMIVWNFRKKNFGGDPSLGRTLIDRSPGRRRRPRRASARKREFLLTVYKRACIFPPEHLEERRDRAEIRHFAGGARPAGVPNGGTLWFAKYFTACAR